MSKYFLLIALIINFFIHLQCFAFDPQSAAFSINAEKKDINNIDEVRVINELLSSVENDWNNHNLKGVFKYYAEDFVNGDGLSIESVKNLTKELWEAYPDIKSESKERTVRVYGDYATVESVDIYYGSSSKVREEVGSKGILKAVSIGNLFLKKFGPKWKITSDKTVVEKVSIGYGLGTEFIDQDKIQLSAPEQVISGRQYTAKLVFNLPEDIKPVAAISKEMLLYPQHNVEDKFRLASEPVLEKLVSANNISKNELITATIGLTGGALKPKLLGLVFLTKRVNVIPVSEQKSEVSIIKIPAKNALSKEADFLDNYSNEQKTKQEQEESPSGDIKE